MLTDVIFQLSCSTLYASAVNAVIILVQGCEHKSEIHEQNSPLTVVEEC